MRWSFFATTLYFLFLSCAIPVVPEIGSLIELACEDVICPRGYYCADIGELGVCLRDPTVFESCNLPCAPGEECRADRCISSDPNGQICEFDGACLEHELCILGHCSMLDCIPGETLSCYAGSPGTIGIGECTQGYYLCTNSGFYTTECIGEILPREEVGLLACNGKDDNCDGLADDGSLDTVDIVFVFDISDSMSDSLSATIIAIGRTAAMYNDPQIRLGLVVFPDPLGFPEFRPLTTIHLTTYEDFILEFSTRITGIWSNGYKEASWDILYLLAENKQPGIDFRPGAKKIVIMFTDEQGQSYIDMNEDGVCQEMSICDVDEDIMCNSIRGAGVELYTFVDRDGWRWVETGSDSIPISEDFDDCSTIFYLSDNPDEMVDNLTDLISDVCS